MSRLLCKSKREQSDSGFDGRFHGHGLRLRRILTHGEGFALGQKPRFHHRWELDQFDAAPELVRNLAEFIIEGEKQTLGAELGFNARRNRSINPNHALIPAFLRLLPRQLRRGVILPRLSLLLADPAIDRVKNTARIKLHSQKRGSDGPVERFQFVNMHDVTMV